MSQYERRGNQPMMDPQTATFLAGRIEPHQDRDAEQLAAVRDARAGNSSRVRPALERVHAFFARSESPASASCDCTD
jgi:hypothetical protein